MENGNLMNKAVFLDRDGTINVEKGYLYKTDEFEFISGAEEAIHIFNELNYLVIVVSNQSGIGRGYYSVKDVYNLHQYINRLLALSNSRIDGFYFCPHEPKDGCRCRKPQTLLFEKAQREHNIDMNYSYIVGDKLSDIEAAAKLRCNYALVLTGHGKEQDRRKIPVQNIYDNLLSFAQNLRREEFVGE